MYEIGIIGIGKMGGSILNGIISSNIYKSNEIIIYDTNKEILNKYNFKNIKIATTIDELLQNSKMSLFAIKPQVFLTLQNEIKKDAYKTIIISIMAGITINTLKEKLGNIKCVRVMPNTPALINKAVSAISKDNLITEEEFKEVKKIFTLVGKIYEIDDNKMNEIIPLNGSMPAYLYYFVEGFLENAKKSGIDPDLAKELIVNSIISSCEMILTANKDISELRNDVCSKGGTTLAGLDILKQNDFLDIIDKTCDACIKRAYELSK